MELVCTLGRGIERVQAAGGGAWRPTRYIEKASENGSHSGCRAPGLDPSDESAVIAGSNANLLATVQFVEELARAGSAPPLVTFAAGRPAYLAGNPDPALSEGRVMAEKLARLLRLNAIPVPEIVIQARNTNTRDDIEQTLKLAAGRGLRRLAMITVAVHISRLREMLRWLVDLGQAPAGIAVSFIASESLLLKRYGPASRYARLLAQLEQSAAYRRTVEQEQQGIDALRAGTYRFGSE
jgi:hypothetical protein